jgi:hypothetical protein
MVDPSDTNTHSLHEPHVPDLNSMNFTRSAFLFPRFFGDDIFFTFPKNFDISILPSFSHFFKISVDAYNRGRGARGGHGLLKASLRPAMTNPSTTCGQATTKKAVLGWLTRRAGGLRPSSTLLETPRRAPLLTT